MLRVLRYQTKTRTDAPSKNLTYFVAYTTRTLTVTLITTRILMVWRLVSEVFEDVLYPIFCTSIKEDT